MKRSSWVSGQSTVSKLRWYLRRGITVLRIGCFLKMANRIEQGRKSQFFNTQFPIISPRQGSFQHYELNQRPYWSRTVPIEEFTKTIRHLPSNRCRQRITVVGFLTFIASTTFRMLRNVASSDNIFNISQLPLFGNKFEELVI